MTKKQLDYKLVNIVLIAVIIYLTYQTKNFWIEVVSIIKSILLPLLIGFIIAYAIYPLTKKLTNKKIPKPLAILTIISTITIIIILIINQIIPIFKDQIITLFEEIITFTKQISIQYNISLDTLQKQLATTFDNTIEKIGILISQKITTLINASINIITQILIIITSAIYFLIDMDNIRKTIKKQIKNKKIRNYIKQIEKEINNYLFGLVKIIIISFIEYTILYKIIGHPNANTLALLAAIGNLIPYFGGIITNIIAMITAFVISPKLLTKTIILFIIFSAIDGYIINPLVYKNTNKIHPLIIIISVFAGGILGGIIGIFLALPISIIIITTIKYYKNDIKTYLKQKQLDKP